MLSILQNPYKKSFSILLSLLLVLSLFTPVAGATAIEPGQDAVVDTFGDESTEQSLDNEEQVGLAGDFNLQSSKSEIEAQFDEEQSNQEGDLSFSDANPSKFAVFEDNSIPISVRIEGLGETIVPLTKLEVNAYDISHAAGVTGDYSLGKPRAIHAIVKVLESSGFDVTDQTKFDFGGGNFITNVDGLKMNSINPGMDGWMYFVNNEYAPVGIGDFQLKENDSITLYFVTSYFANTFTWFNQESPVVHSGEDFQLELTGDAYGATAPIENATILVNNQPLKIDNQEIMTDDEGSVTLRFDTPGEYHISAQRIEDGYSNITRPYAKVTVLEKEPEVPAEDIIQKIEQAIEKTTEHILSQDVSSEWQAIGLGRAGVPVPTSYEGKFFNNLKSEVLNKVGSGSLKVTDVERLAIAAAAIGKDATNINEDGFNLIEKIYNSEHWTWENTDSIIYQGNNGIIFGLIALDSKGFEVPDGAKWTRDKLVAELLENQHTSGAWGLTASSTGSASLDITAMALIGLAPYIEDSVVKKAVDKALAFLSEKQGLSGGFNDPWNGGVSSELTSQVIIGLTANNIDPRSEEFTKEGINLVDHLLSFQADDGGFKHIVTDTRSNGMATEQALQALVAFDLFLKDEGRLYDFGKEVQPNPEVGVIPVPSDKPFELDDEFQPDASKPVILDFGKDGKQVLPKVTAERGNTRLEIPTNTTITSPDWDGRIQAPTVLVTGEGMKATINEKLIDKKISKIGGHIKVGGDKPIVFSEYVTLTFKGYGQYEAGLIDTSGNFELIKKYPTMDAAKDAQEDVYAYPDGNDLIIKTKHFTEFLTFETEAVEPETPGTGGGGGTTVPSTEKVKLSVEKRTMDGTDIIQAIDVELQSGDTAFTLLKRVADERGIQIDYIGNVTTLYVQAIGGLGEFDGGPDSGWMYSVNGIYPNYSAGLYTLQDGDVLRWRYTKDLGHDIGGGYVPGGGGGPTPEPTPETEEITVAPNQPFVLDEKLQGNVSTPVVLNFGEGTTELPQVTAPRGDSVLEIPQGTKVISAWDGKLQVPTSQSTSQSDLEAINKVLVTVGKEIGKVDLRIKVGGKQTIQFDQHVTLTFKGKAGLTPGFIGTDGQFEIIGTNPTADVYYYVSGNDLIVKTNHFTEFLLFNATGKTIVFPDVKGHWAEEFIQQATRLGIIKGHVDGTFKPDKHLTRAQAVSILVRALDLQTEEAAPFKDIKGYAAETQAEIAAAYKYGLVIGQDGKFMPSKKVSRSQMALMLHRAYEQKTGVKYVAKEIAPYPDFDHYDEETINAISMLYEMGIATGSNGKYMPANPTQRAHAAKMLVNFFNELK